MSAIYPAKAHADKVASQLPGGVFYLKGDTHHLRHDTDMELPFRQESNFFYVTGCYEADYQFIYANSESYLVIPVVTGTDLIWHGPQTTPEDLKHCQVDNFLYESEFGDFLKKLNPTTIHVLPNADTSKLGSYESCIEVGHLSEALAEARIIKDEHEIELMRTANRISFEAHQHLQKIAHPGISESELESEFEAYTRKRGLKFQAYTPIIGAGPNAAVLHYNKNNKSTSQDPSQLVLVDAGAENSYYAADITRTWPVGGKFSKQGETIYNIVKAMQDAVLAAIKPGVQWEDMHRLANRICVEGLIVAGILQGELQELLNEHTGAIFFPHGLGHSIGLDVHDVGGYPKSVQRITEPALVYLRMRRELRAGMVVTVEPGCYFNDALIENALADEKQKKFINTEVLTQYRGIGGVRLEDCVLITETGHENLTRQS